MPSRSWRFPGIHPLARVSRTVFAALLAGPLALAPLAGPVFAHPAHSAAPTTGKVVSPAVDLTLHFRSTLVTGVDPTLISADAQGNLYVTNQVSEQVLMYDANDSFVRAIGTGAGSGNGQFNIPVGVAATSGTVYVADYTNNRIQTFNQSTGAYLSQFGNSQLNHPNGLALGSNGTLYVVDTNNNRIAEFNTGGTFLGSFGTVGAGNGQFNGAVGIAFNATNGDLYVTDTGNSRVEAFTLGGTYVTQWGSGSFTAPLGIAVDRAGMVYVMDVGAKTVYKFDPGGSLVGDYAAPSTTPFVLGTFAAPTGVAVRSLPNTPLAVYVGDGGMGLAAGFVQRFDQVLAPQVHTYQAQWGSTGSGHGQFNNPQGVVVDPAGNVYVADGSNNRVEKFDPFGNFLLAFGTSGTGNSQFNFPAGLAISPGGNTLYVVDNGNNRIEEFSPAGTYLGQFGGAGSANGQFTHPAAIASDGTHLYVADNNNDRIEVFSTAGVYQSQFGSAGSGSTQFAGPDGIAVDNARQELFISDFGNNRVQVYTTGGSLITSLTSAASLNFNGPQYVSADQRGDVYVADSMNQRIVEFDVNLTRTTAFGTTGSGQLVSPTDATVSPTNGQIYAADLGNNRVERFGSPWPKHDTVGIYRPSTKTFYLRNENSTGPAEITVPMPYAQAGDLPVVGDWNGDGVDTVGLYRTSTGNFLLQDANVSESAPDYVFTLGNPGDTPIAGDWNGDGSDGAGIFRPSNGILYLKNQLSTGFADESLVLGVPGDKGIAGDWNGDGQDSPGVYRPSNETFYVTNKVTNGIVYGDATAVLGISGDAPFTGDWVAQGSSGIGVFRPSNGITYEKNAISTGFADNNFIYGVAGDIPVAGQWVAPSAPFAAPAPHTSLGTHTGSSAPHRASGWWSGGHSAPRHSVSTRTPAATTPRRTAAR